MGPRSHARPRLPADVDSRGPHPGRHAALATAACAIAARIVQERRTGPPASPDQQLTAERYERYELSPADDERVDAALADLLGLPAAITIRAAHEAEPSVRDHDSFASGLVSGIAANRLRFLDVELNLGNTLLDLASVTRISASRARRVARAWETHDEVARALARGDHPAFTAAEQEGLEDGLARLRSRLDAFG